MSEDPMTDLVTLWRELLADDTLDADANFFVHGGHSLLGLSLLARIEEEAGIDLALADLFDCPTPARLAERVRAAR